MTRQKLLVGIASAVIGVVTLVGSGRFAATAHRINDSERSDTETVVSRNASSGSERRLGRTVSAALEPIFRQP